MAVEYNAFWSNAISTEVESAPKTILALRATELGLITKNIVTAEIRTSIQVEDHDGFIEKPEIMHCFDIIAPILGYQRITLFCITQLIGMEFPLKVFSTYWEKKEECECQNIEMFNQCLKEVLSSEKTAQVINQFIALSK